MMQPNSTRDPRQTIDRADFLELSPYEVDAGNLIGRDPRQLPLSQIRQLKHPESPVRAIRVKCVDCCSGNAAEARKCTAVHCPLWPLRMGSSPYHTRSRSAQLDAAKVATSSEGRAN